MTKQYRVWDKVAEKMYYAGDCKFSIDLSGSLYDDSQTPPLNIDYRCVLMEDTGLIDKTGKRIFKGDILKFTEIDEFSAFGAEETYVTEVKWIPDLSQWRVVFPSGRRTELHCVLQVPYFYDQEVIGNIYQHPELLQE